MTRNEYPNKLHLIITDIVKEKTTMKVSKTNTTKYIFYLTSKSSWG